MSEIICAALISIGCPSINPHRSTTVLADSSQMASVADDVVSDQPDITEVIDQDVAAPDLLVRLRVSVLVLPRSRRLRQTTGQIRRPVPRGILNA